MNNLELHTVCLPIGFSKTGSQPLADALTAHPNIAMSKQLNLIETCLRKHKWWNIRKSLDIDTLFSRILEMDGRPRTNNMRSARNKKNYAIPGQWQGHYKHLTVIGDCSPESNTISLSNKHCKPLHLLASNIKLPLSFIFLARNPYDIISSTVLASYSKTTRLEKLNKATGKFTSYCVKNEALLAKIAKMPEQHVYIWHLEDHINAPYQELAKLCDFLEIEKAESYLNACAKIFFRKPSKNRYLIDWPEKHKALVAETIKKYDFFSGYSWHS